VLVALSVAPAAAAKDAPAKDELRFRTVTRDDSGGVASMQVRMWYF